MTRNNGHKLAEGRFRLDIRRRYLTVRAARIWNQLPSKVVLAPTLGVFKRRLDVHLAGVVCPQYSFLPWQGVGLEPMAGCLTLETMKL